jgi:hypothetical protein
MATPQRNFQGASRTISSSVFRWQTQYTRWSIQALKNLQETMAWEAAIPWDDIRFKAHSELFIFWQRFTFALRIWTKKMS